jgi:glycosyltransferase involved in cell wall biosynthesis
MLCHFLTDLTAAISLPLNMNETPPRTLVSVVTPCFNEAGNVDELCDRLQAAFAKHPDIDFLHLFIDNASTDGTVAAIRRRMEQDSRIGYITNMRNFGHVRSPLHGFLQAPGDVVIVMASDLQDPPELIGEFLSAWRQGALVVAGVKRSSKESGLMWLLRTLYYRTLSRIASVDLIEHFTGFGLYDRLVVEEIRQVGDAYPYVRGLISELGFPVSRVEYDQSVRRRGISKNNFYTLYDLAMTGITSHSKVPLRLAAMAGFALSALSLAISLAYIVLKFIFWDSFSFGLAPVLIGIFFLGSVQLFFIGLVGEYVGAIHTQLHKRPLVIEKERVNFPPYGDA